MLVFFFYQLLLFFWSHGVPKYLEESTGMGDVYLVFLYIVDSDRVMERVFLVLGNDIFLIGSLYLFLCLGISMLLYIVVGVLVCNVFVTRSC